MVLEGSHFMRLQTWISTFAVLVFTALHGLGMVSSASHTDPFQQGEEAELDMDAQNESSRLKVATFGAGCFWCVEAIFQQLKGVEKVVSGYSGGHVDRPTYDQVCKGNTGHAEVIQVTYDPKKVSFDELLEVFWKTHDPTTSKAGYR